MRDKGEIDSTDNPTVTALTNAWTDKGKPRDYVERLIRWVIENRSIKSKVYPRLDNEALENALEALGVECRYNLRSSRAELREGNDWEPTNDRTVAKLVTTIAKRFSYSVHRGDAPLKYGRENWNLNFSALLKGREVDPFLLWLEALPQWDRTDAH